MIVYEKGINIIVCVLCLYCFRDTLDIKGTREDGYMIVYEKGINIIRTLLCLYCFRDTLDIL